MQANQTQCEALKYNGLQCSNAAWAIVTYKKKEEAFCRLHLSQQLANNDDLRWNADIKTIDPKEQKNCNSLVEFLNIGDNDDSTGTEVKTGGDTKTDKGNTE
jgi:hypothetical protein